LVREVSALKDFVSHLVWTQLNLAKWRLRTVLLGLVAGAVALACVTALAVVAGVYVLQGVAVGLGIVFGGRLWLGELVTGLLALAGLGGLSAYGVMRGQSQWQAKKARENAERKAIQRARHGRDVDDAAREAA
jgi:hypothetical protein